MPSFLLCFSGHQCPAALALLLALGMARAQMTFPAAGNVGIGTTAPTQMLDVTGSPRVRGLSDATTRARLPQAQPTGALALYELPASTGPNPYAAQPQPLNPMVTGSGIGTLTDRSFAFVVLRP